MISVVVADDDPLVRTALKTLLEVEDDLDVVGEAADGREAIDVVVARRPDVVLLDVRMPNLDGLGALRRIAAETDTRVIMLTTFDLDEYVYAAMHDGASGFLLKDAPPERLAAAIRVVAAGESLLAPAITRRLVERFTSTGTDSGNRLAELTARELEILKELARGRTNAEIASALVLSEATVKTHVSHVFAKLMLRDRAQAVVVAYETGLVRPGSTSPLQ
jgi:DNA-binding NarL/FixJ family response regulator